MQVSIYGTNLANGVASTFAPAAPVLSLAGASVTIGGIPSPVTYASPTQLDVQVPFEIAAGVPSVNVIVTLSNVASAPVLMGVVTADLGMFSAQANATIFAPSAANTVTVQATPGTVVTIYASGLGLVSPSIESGIGPAGTSSIKALVVPAVAVNGTTVAVLSANYIALGLFAVTVDVPASASSGTVIVTFGAMSGAAGSYRGYRRKPE